jgi:hypothetical protein
MARVKATEDVYAPHPSGREGTFHLVARKGSMYDPDTLGAAEKPTLVTSAATQAEGTTDDATDGGYDSMKVTELRALADDRGIDHDGLKKDELVEALEQADQGA